MKLHKYLIIFFISLFIVSAVLAGFNIAVDPFGVFGDRFIDWYAYDMTQNPRIAKIAYIDKHHDEYDSYIIGSSKTSSYSVEKLNEYYGGAHFYNMIMYGGDLYDAQKTAEYLINNYNVKNIILNIGIEEMYKYNYEDDATKGNLHAKVDNRNLPLFYLKYAFLNPQYSINKLTALAERDYLPTENDVFVPETGAYNKDVRDAEGISDLISYMENNPNFYVYREDNRHGVNMDKAVESVRIVKDLCESRGIDFKLIASPLFDTEIEDYDYNDLCQYWQKLADVSDIYDFTGYSPISMDPRYFYDDAHFRNSVGDMVLAWIFGDTDKYIPDGFGHSTRSENAYEYAQQIFKRPDDVIPTYMYAKQIPILMYHEIGEEDGENGMIVSPERLESHLRVLSENGYTAIRPEDLCDYVYRNLDLPEKPIMITFDDGYLSNYEYSWLFEDFYSFATVFQVGATVGANTYKETGQPIYPHFNYEQAREMVQSGHFSIQSHTYDFHRVKEWDTEYRDGASKLNGESDKAFAELFKADLIKSKTEIEENAGNEVFALAYPDGRHSILTDTCARQCGFMITLTRDEGTNTVVKGLPQSLYNLKRIGVYPNITSEELLKRISE